MIRWYFIGIFFNLILPTSIGGDAAKVYYLSEETKAIGSSILSVFFDRYIGMFAILCFATAAAIYSRVKIGDHLVYPYLVLISLIAVLISFFLTTNYSQWVKKVIPDRFPSLKRFVEKFNLCFRVLLNNPRNVGICFGLSILFLFTLVIVHYILIAGLGHKMEIAHLMVFIPLIALATLVPFTINGLGIREGAYILLFSSVGLTMEECFAVAFYILAIGYITGSVGGILYALMGGSRGKIEKMEATARS
jgi:uncharacterized protein (TIRG00374 family)